MTPDETAGLVAFYHRLHALTVDLVTTARPVANVADLVLELLDAVEPLVPVLHQVAPAVCETLSQLDDVADIAALRTELTEVHRLLGHVLRRDLGIDPGRPPQPVGDVLRDLVDNGKHLPPPG